MWVGDNEVRLDELGLTFQVEKPSRLLTSGS